MAAADKSHKKTLPIFPGEFTVCTFPDECGHTASFTHPSGDRGVSYITDLLPGIGLANYEYFGDGIGRPVWLRMSAVIFHYCIEGPLDADCGLAGSLRLFPGDVALAEMAAGCYRFPSGHAKGIELLFLPQNMDEDTRALLDVALVGIRFPETSFGIVRGGVPELSHDARAILEEFSTYRPMRRDQLEPAREAIKQLLGLLSKRPPCVGEEELSRYYHVTPAQRAMAQRARDKILEDISVRHSSDELAKRLGVSATTLKSHFQYIYGETPAEFANRVRMGRAKILLESTNLPIAEIAGMVGYGSSGKFSSAFRRTTGFLPAQYRHASLHSGTGDSEADDGSRSGKGARLG